MADVGLFAAHGDAFEPLELADCLFDARSEFTKAFRKKAPTLLGVFATWDNRCDAARACRRPVGLAVISFVRHRDAWADVGTDVQRRLELCAGAGLAGGQMEVERVAVEIGLEVDFSREATARAAERLVLLPPFAPAAETCARTTVLSKNCTTCALLLVSASSCRKASNTPERLSRFGNPPPILFPIRPQGLVAHQSFIHIRS